MAGREDETTSFDPRTWAEGAPPPAAAAPAETANTTRDATSFDPRAWASDDQAPPPEPPPIAPAGGARGGNRRALLGAGAAVVVAAIGGGVFYMRGSRSPALPGSAPAPSETASAAVAAADRQVGRRTLSIASAADILPTLTAAAVPATEAGAAAKIVATALGAAPGDIRLEFDIVTSGGATHMTRLVATRDDGSGVSLTAKTDAGFATEKLQAKLTARVEVVRGEMDANSFYSAAVAAGVEDTLIDPFANAFSYDFNFATDVKAGDVFEAAFEQKHNPSGQAVGKPRLLYVSMTTSEKSRSLYSFLAPGDTEPGWFDANGRSTVRALMRTPVDGARISSPFGMRFHPVLHFNKLHRGTDFAAPTGTPIYAAGNGTIAWAAMKGANGNLTVLQHDNGWQTLYLHQSMFMPGIAPGVRVSQGQKIGEIGTTGRSTGPHLHFELHIDGEPVDPMSIDTGTGVSLAGGALIAFKKERDRIDQARASQSS